VHNAAIVAGSGCAGIYRLSASKIDTTRAMKNAIKKIAMITCSHFLKGRWQQASRKTAICINKNRKDRSRENY